MGLLVIAVLIVFSLLLISGVTCLFIGHFRNEPEMTRCGRWLLCATPLSVIIPLLIIDVISWLQR